MRTIGAILMLAMLVAGCGPSAAERQAEVDRAVKQALAKAEAERAAKTPEPVVTASKDAVAVNGLRRSPAAQIPITQEDAESEYARPETPAPPQGAEPHCWQDYCPCEEVGPTDRMICRNLKGGLPVPDHVMAAGAAHRDMRASMDDWNRRHPEDAIDY